MSWLISISGKKKLFGPCYDPDTNEKLDRSALIKIIIEIKIPVRQLFRREDSASPSASNVSGCVGLAPEHQRNYLLRLLFMFNIVIFCTSKCPLHL